MPSVRISRQTHSQVPLKPKTCISFHHMSHVLFLKILCKQCVVGAGDSLQLSFLSETASVGRSAVRGSKHNLNRSGSGGGEMLNHKGKNACVVVVVGGVRGQNVIGKAGFCRCSELHDLSG